MPPPPDNVNALQQLMLHGGQQAFDLVPKLLSRVIEERQWARHNDKHGKPFASFEAFIHHPYWQGLESTIDDLRLYCRKHPEVTAMLNAEIGALPADGGDRRSQEFQINNVKLKTIGGNNPTYALKRLKRDRPDLAERVIKGELSANAAAIAAGFRKQPSPIELAHKLVPKLTDIEWQTLKRDEDARRLAELASEAAEDAGSAANARRLFDAMADADAGKLTEFDPTDRMARSR